MKLAQMIMFFAVLQVLIIFFTGSYSGTSYTLDPYNSTTIVNNTSPGLWEFMADPTNWSLTDVLLAIATVTGAAAAAVIIIGTFFSQKSDTLLFVPIAALLFSFGAIPMISLYNVFMSNGAIFGCTSIPCSNAILMYLITGGTLAIFYLLAVLEWWSGRTTS